MLETLAREPSGQAPIVEVGVYKGGSAWYLANAARARGCALHLFDTFTGIPFQDPEDENYIGKFGDTSQQAVAALIPDALFHVGLFPQTMPADLTSVSFVHCDCDQYRSVKAVIEVFWPLLTPGGIMAFDDIYTTGGKRAILEVFPDIEMDRGWWYTRKDAPA